MKWNRKAIITTNLSWKNSVATEGLISKPIFSSNFLYKFWGRVWKIKTPLEGSSQALLIRNLTSQVWNFESLFQSHFQSSPCNIKTQTFNNDITATLVSVLYDKNILAENQKQTQAVNLHQR